MLKIDKTGVSTSKRVYFRYSCRLWLLSWRRARVFARSCSLLSKYLPISWKQRKEQSHAQCHVTHRIRIFDKISNLSKLQNRLILLYQSLPLHFITILYRSHKNFMLKYPFCTLFSPSCLKDSYKS